MSSGKNSAAKEASRRYGQMAREAYGLGIPMLKARNEALMPALRQTMLGGELPDYMEGAFDTQRTGLAEGMTARERQQIGAQDMASKGAVRGGNLSSAMNPAQMGSALADAMMGSRVNQGMATINQANTLMSMGLGGAAQTGNQAVGAAGQQLQAISMLPNYNPTYAGVLGVANAGFTAYQKGLFGGRGVPGQPGQPVGQGQITGTGTNWGGGPGAPINWGGGWG